MRTITGTLLTVDGLPIANTEVSFSLVDRKALPTSSFDATTFDRVYGSKSVVTDVSGNFTISLYENTKLVDVTGYLVKVNIPNDAPFIASLAEGVAALDWLEFKAGGSVVEPAQLLILTEFMDRTEAAALATEADRVAVEADRVVATQNALLAQGHANYQGEWTAKGYTLGQSVNVGTVFYVCKLTHTTSQTPSTVSTYWTVSNNVTLKYVDDAISSLWVGAVFDETLFQIGLLGSIGFGVGAIPPWLLPSNYTRLEGHYEPSSPNYGNVLDPMGSVMVWIPKFYVRWNVNNTVGITHIPTVGYALHRSFIDNGVEQEGVLVDKYGCGNVAGVFVSKQGIDPCSTATAHNPISALNNAPANNYGGLYKAVKTRGVDHFLTSIFIYNALATLAHAAGIVGTNCAFSGIAPLHPKGNNNNALKDVNDISVTFTGSGYSNCALTGSGVPFAKTTHNGQACGVADLNGNMYEVASGFIKYGTTDAMFKLLKESTKIGNILTDNTVQASGGAYDIDLYDTIDLTGTMSGVTTASKFGNGANQVFEMNTDRLSLPYKKTMAGLPMALGYSAAGAAIFGNDYYYEAWVNQMAPIVGGSWSTSSAAGVFALNVGSFRTGSYGDVGGRASVYL